MIYNHCHPEQRRGILKNRRFLHALYLVGMTMMLFSFPLHAQEDTKNFDDILNETALPEGAVKYAPEDCDFELVFPDKPYTAKRCPDGIDKKDRQCYDFTSFTMVYDVTSTIEINVTCVASTPDQYERYSEPVIKTALKGMLDRGEIENHEINTSTKENFRIGSLLGTAQRGRQNSIYNAQILVGQNSVMTVESRLIGPSHDEADEAFGKIISSIKKQD